MENLFNRLQFIDFTDFQIIVNICWNADPVILPLIEVSNTMILLRAALRLIICVKTKFSTSI